MIALTHGSALMSDWFDRQKALFEALTPKIANQPEKTPSAELGPKPEEVWSSYMDFWASFAKAVPEQAGALDGGALESLVTPAMGGRNSLGPPDPKTPIENATSFATLWDWDQKTLKAYGAWLALQQAIAVQRAIVDAAWADAAARFREAIAHPVDEKNPAITSWSVGLELWLETANTRLLEMQRSDEFLRAQRRLLAASLDYRLKLREIAEELCELYQVPTRTEIDELSRLVHELRREVRALKHSAKQASRGHDAG